MNIPFRRTLIAAALAAALVAALAAPAHAAPDDRAMAPSGKDHQSLYWQGHEQLKAGRWEDAAARFAELEQALRQSEPASADAALYWRAYAQAKGKRVGEARASLDRLVREFPDSRWKAEVARLRKELGGATHADKDDNALVDAAIDGLIAAPPERSLPLLKRVMDGNYPTRSKRRALFVLSQLDSPEASALVLQSARSGDLPLRREAISMLGIGGDPAAMQALQEIYRSAPEPEIRRAVLDAYMVAGHKAGLLAVALDPAEPKLQRQAVNLLGASGGNDELRRLLDQQTDETLLDAVVDALGIADDSATLVAVARDGRRTPKLRGSALQALGIGGNAAELGTLYRELDDPALREAALHGLLIAGASKQLTELYKAARNDEEKRRVLRVLTTVGDDAALDAIEAAITAGERQ
jgi:HEAT repeat protein